MKSLRILSSIILLANLITIGLSEENMKEYQFFPNLPVGKYHTLYKAIFRCSLDGDELLRHNLYLYKISHNTTIQKGNLTFKIPLNDSLSFNINMAVKDSIGGWKDNAFILKVPNACTWYKKMWASEWTEYWKSFGLNDTNCPIPAGTHISKGYDLSRIVTHSKFPKTFFYGTYKSRVFFTDKNNEVQGCYIVVMEIKRPWENE